MTSCAVCDLEEENGSSKTDSDGAEVSFVTSDDADGSRPYLLLKSTFKDASASTPHFFLSCLREKELETPGPQWRCWVKATWARAWLFRSHLLTAATVTSLNGFRPLPQRFGITRSDGSRKIYIYLTWCSWVVSDQRHWLGLQGVAVGEVGQLWNLELG